MTPYKLRDSQKSAAVPWYFVCETCCAKWFAETNRSHCPRCQTQAISKEQIRPPWWCRERPQTQPNAVTHAHEEYAR